MPACRLRGLALLVAFLVTIYTLTSSGRFHIIDEVSLFAVTESLAQRGDVDTNAITWTQWVNSPGEVLGTFGPDGHVYSKKGPAPAFLSVPWYTLIRLGTKLGLPWGLLQGTLLWNGLVTAATAALLWLVALRLGYGDRTGMLLGLLFGLGTIAWPYANHLFGEPLSALSLLLCFYGLQVAGGSTQGVPEVAALKGNPKEQRTVLSRWDGSEGTGAQGRKGETHALHTTSYLWLAGLGAGIAIATVTAHALLVALLGLYLLYSVSRNSPPTTNHQPPTTNHQPPTTNHKPLAIRLLLPFVLCLLLSLLLLAWYNFVRFGDPLDTGYHFDSGEGFTTPIWQGFWGLIGSPYRGAFWHTPLFIGSLCVFPAFLRRHRAVGLLIAALSALLIGLYSTWWMWWGGFAWGPRFLVPLTPFWVLLLAPLVERIGIGDGGLRIESERGAQYPSSNPPSPWLRRGFILLAALSLLVQVSAVLVNYANYEYELRAHYPTDWRDPLRYGPPAQSLADLLDSPVIGQWRLMMRDFVANTDLAWLWAEGTIVWPVVAAAGMALAVLSVGLWAWWHGRDKWRVASGGAQRIFEFATIVAAPALVIGVWLSSVGGSPTYGESGRGYRAILAEIGEGGAVCGAVVTVAPYHYQIPMNWFGGIYRGGLPIFGYATSSAEHPETIAVLNSLLQDPTCLWYVTAGQPPADPANTVERWLADHAYQADDRWFDDFRLVRYATPAALAGVAVRRQAGILTDADNQVAVVGLRSPQTATTGTVLPVELHYRIEAAGQPLRWFIQLLGPDGAPAALLDTAPLDGYIPFPDLPRGEALVERVGLALPPDLAPGAYQLIAGLYNPSGARAPRLRTETGSDALDLGTVVVQ